MRLGNGAIGRLEQKGRVNLGGVREEILNWKFEDDRRSAVRDCMLKFHFPTMLHSDKLKILDNHKEGDKPRKSMSVSEETFSRLKFKRVLVVAHSVQSPADHPHKDPSLASSKNAILPEDPRNVLIFEFEGVLGLARVSSKGLTELVVLKNLKSLFKKLNKYFHIVVVFRRRNSPEFYRKIMDFAKKFEHLVKAFAVVRNPFEKPGSGERPKVKLGSYGKFGSKEARRRTVTATKKMPSGQLIVDMAEVERLFPAQMKLLFVSSLKKDLGSYAKSRLASGLRRDRNRRRPARPATARVETVSGIFPPGFPVRVCQEHQIFQKVHH